MSDFANYIIYFFLFISLYFEVFLVITYFENRPKLRKEKTEPKLAYFPTVTIIVPCFNEETTIDATVSSLLSLDYPKDRFSISIVDDGSSDNTWKVIQKYRKHPQISLHRKKNGGKHTALNLAISKTKSDLVGCLDADSFVEPSALKRIAVYFEDRETMAVIPSIKVHEPENWLQRVQRVEYGWGIFLRKILSYLDALYVTPGPFSFFRREIFDKLGPYRHAHNTEDLEIALRMQRNNLKITNSHLAFVYTVTPKKLVPLFKQRLRWTYGFLRNAIDYRDLIFSRKHGNLGLIIIPVGMISIVSAVYLTVVSAFTIMSDIVHAFWRWKAIGFAWRWPTFSMDWFFLDTGTKSLIAILMVSATVFLVLVGRKLAYGKVMPSMEILYFLFIYPIIAPVWLAKSLYNLALSKGTSWR